MSLDTREVFRACQGFCAAGRFSSEHEALAEDNRELRFRFALLHKAGVTISMDDKGAWRDNVFVERLWRSVNYEEVSLKAYTSVGEARASIGRYWTFYNSRRPHSSLDRQTPDQAYFIRLPQSAAA